MATTGTTESDAPEAPDELLVAALARGATHQQAAEESGLSTRTISRRLTDPTFRERVSTARREWLDLATSALASALHEAVAALKAIMREGESEMARLGAARAIVSMLLPLRQSVDFEQRLERLEAAR